MKENIDLINKIYIHLKDSEYKKTKQITDTEAFLKIFLSTGEIPSDICKKFGDLLIALESVDIPRFFTVNYKESLFFCEAIKQLYWFVLPIQ